MGENLIRANIEQLVEALKAAGWDARATVVTQGDGTIVAGLSAWVSFLPSGAAFPPRIPDLVLPNGEPVRR